METLRPSDRRSPRYGGAGPGPGVRRPAGFRVLIPGCAQWAWGQRERGAVLFGSVAAAMAVSAFVWGTPLSLAVLAFAFGAHVTSVVDALRQAAFPALGRWAGWLTATGWLGGGVYLPALAL